VLLGLLGWTNATLAQAPKPEQPPKVEPGGAQKDIVEAAREAKLMTFAKLVESADLTKTLKDKGPYTVFAPTDEAFKKLGQEKLDDLMKPEHKMELQRILKNHVVMGKHMAAQVKSMKECKTMTGMVPVTVKEDQVMFGTAKVVKTDLAASNGVIHTIDAVVMPMGEEAKPATPKPARPAGGGGGG
jgi:uncharacterized surface protein with fasciclin (FAS1) repeats